MDFVRGEADQSGDVCQICIDNVHHPFQLKCGHQFCRSCLSEYSKVKIQEGESDILCCFIVETLSDGQKNPYKYCNSKFPEDIVLELQSDDAEVVAKYQRFKFFRENPNGRECPQCCYLQIGSPKNPKIVCEKCSNEFCFLHGGAHNGKTCSEFEQSIAVETASTNEVLLQTSKPCPGCGIQISKTAGCNHMKCPKCHSAFCWICGKAIQDTVFPAHFQWWNPNGCSNMQMSEEITPSLRTRKCGKLMAGLQAIAVGPCTVLSAILTFIICGPICIKRTGNWQNTKQNIKDFFAQNLTIWGGIWLFIIVLFPVILIVGSICAAFFCFISILKGVRFMIIRIYNKQYPWPDSVSTGFDAVYKYIIARYVISNRRNSEQAVETNRKDPQANDIEFGMKKINETLKLPSSPVANINTQKTLSTDDVYLDTEDSLANANIAEVKVHQMPITTTDIRNSDIQLIENKNYYITLHSSEEESNV